MSALVVRPITPDEVPAVIDCVNYAFGNDPTQDPQVLDRVRATAPPGRMLAAFDGELAVATASTYTFTLTTCGGTAPMGGLTIVTVRPTHRRRGLLRQLMAAHLADVRARREPISGLYASEGTIYSQFGYGVAVESDELVLAGGDDLFPTPRDRELVTLTDDQALATLPTIYAEAALIRPGMYARSHEWWQWRRIVDRPSWRRGRSPRRHVVVRDRGVNRGYVVYRQHLEFTDGRPSGTIDVEELIALDPAAEATLWHHVAAIDLYPKITVGNAAVDTIAPRLARDPRRVVRRNRHDTLWLRLDDIAAALAARRYAHDAALTLELAGGPDADAPTRWRLVVDGGAGSCVPAVASPDVTLDRATLGALYLGGVSASLLARAGKLAGTADAMARLDRLFAWPTAPWCAEQF